jgi:hypothetical protein
MICVGKPGTSWEYKVFEPELRELRQMQIQTYRVNQK